MCTSNSQYLKADQMLTGSFVTYGLLKNFNRNQQRKEIMGPRLENIPSGAMDTSDFRHEW
jgi:hypothetical protein